MTTNMIGCVKLGRKLKGELEKVPVPSQLPVSQKNPAILFLSIQCRQGTSLDGPWDSKDPVETQIQKTAV